MDPIQAERGPSFCKTDQRTELALKHAYVAKAAREDFIVNEDRIVVEWVGASTPASDRPELIKVLAVLAPFAELVVWHLDDLGKSAADILKTIETVTLQRHSDVYCMAVSPDQLASDTTFMTTLKLLAQIEGRNASPACTSGGPDPSMSAGRVGRPSSINEKTKAAVRAALRQGDTVSTIAKRFETSRQTIMRIRAADGEGTNLS